MPYHRSRLNSCCQGVIKRVANLDFGCRSSPDKGGKLELRNPDGWAET